MSDKHTPGPWRVDPDYWGDVESHTGTQIATVQDSQDAADWSSGTMLPLECEARANARLIAAAPEMLAALRDLTPPIPAADAPCHAGFVPQEKCAYCRRVIQAHAAIAKATGDAP